MDNVEFTKFYRSHLKRVKGWLRSFLKVEADVEDLAQDVFIRVYESWDKKNPNSPIEQWLYNVTKNTAINVLRLRKTRPMDYVGDSTDLENDQALTVKDLNREEELIAKDMIKQIPGEIKLLPPSQKEIVSLAINEQLTPAAISLIINKNDKLVREYMRRGKVRLVRKIRG
jgi:RNA polymerase sigma-70 factor (ECF subfamily)